MQDSSASIFKGAIVAAPHGHADYGLLLNFDPQSSTVRLRPEFLLEVGSWAQIRLATTQGTASAPIRSHVTSRVEEPAGQTYTFRHTIEPSELEALGYRGRKDRRAVRRVRIQDRVCAHLRNLVSGVQLTGELFDVSTTGARVRIPQGGDANFLDATNIQVSFQLGSSTPYAFIAGIRRRGLEASSIYYGLEFDVAGTPNGPAQVERLGALLAELLAGSKVRP